MRTQSVDIDQRKAMGLREGSNGRAAHYAAIIEEELTNRGDLGQAGKAAQGERGFGMALPRVEPAGMPAQGEHMPRPDEVA